MPFSAGPAERLARTEYPAGQLVGGKYRLTRVIGEGAMGAVWVAVNVVLESRVAIKLLNPELRSPALVECFLREARAAAILDHPAIVRVFDLGATDSGDPFIVMELLAGESLSACLDREKALRPERAVQMLLPIAGAIHVAHQNGIVHRDLKPDNIVLAEIYGGRLQPKVVDFGIAKLAWGGENINGATVVGTPAYMSPEQARGLDVVDHRSDVWSLAAVLYEALAGRAPFARGTAEETFDAVVREPAPALDELVGGSLWTILERALRKDPEQRWPTMHAFGDALAAWLHSRGVDEDCSGVSLRTHWVTTPASTVDLELPLFSRPAETVSVDQPGERQALPAPLTRRARAGVVAAGTLLLILGASIGSRSHAPALAATRAEFSVSGDEPAEAVVGPSGASGASSVTAVAVVAAPPSAPVATATPRKPTRARSASGALAHSRVLADRPPPLPDEDDPFRDIPTFTSPSPDLPVAAATANTDLDVGDAGAGHHLPAQLLAAPALLPNPP